MGDYVRLAMFVLTGRLAMQPDDAPVDYVSPDPQLEQVDDEPEEQTGPDDLDGCTLVEDTEATGGEQALDMEEEPVELSETEHAALEAVDRAS
jgi:hypothetical protein